MTDHNDDLKPLAIEGKLPLKAVGIENLREANPGHLPPHRYLHTWFARRPTPASRMAILASLLPQGTDSDQLLKWMQIGPNKNVDIPISKYVEQKKATENERSGNLADHYGYPRSFDSSPTQEELNELHREIREYWDGELPLVLDPTAGGGVIPFEALRYGLPTYANELNPVPSLILKVMLEYAPSIGDIESDLYKWAEEIKNRAAENIESYFPERSDGRIPDNYVCTHKISCKSCGGEIPLVPKWWVRTRGDRIRVVSRPEVTDSGKISYTVIVDPDEDDLSGFDPDDGPISRGGDAECPHCDVVMTDDEVRENIISDEFEFDVICVRHRNPDGSHGFSSPLTRDVEAITEAQKKIDSDFELSTFLSTQIPQGNKTTEPRNYGLEEWRDLFSPRQFISNYAYVESITHFTPKIREKHSKKKAEAILTLCTLSFSKLIDRNSRLTDWDTSNGYPNPLSRGNNYAFKRVFVESNLASGGVDFISYLDRVYESYTKLTTYLPEGSDSATVLNGDAADLNIDDDSIGSVVIDPPYYSSIMYSELSDIFYVWMREILGDVFPDMFGDPLTNKEEEAVANPDRFDSVSGDGTSKKELADRDYERKMSNIFSELYRVLEPGGVMTVMFTHKETDAWDTLTMSLINSGFVITSTHPITSEMPQRAGMRNSASADSTLLLTGRKPHEERDPENAVPTLWSDVEADTREAAKEAARDLLESGISLTKTDVIISAFGPTLRVFADAYPVVDDQDEEVPPRKALETAREAVTQILVDEYLEGMDVDTLDDVTEWYVLCWLVHESETFSYDDGRQLGLGIGVDIDEIKRSTKTWRKSRGDISLRGHDGRVQNINEKPGDRSSRLPIDPDDLSFPRSLDAVHAAMHVYDKKGETVTIEWLRERNFDTDSQFKATLKALLQVLPKHHEDWELARDLAVGRTSDVLDLDFGPNIFADDREDTSQQSLEEF